jgi:hypothetical protein
VRIDAIAIREERSAPSVGQAGCTGLMATSALTIAGQVDGRLRSEPRITV